LDPRREQPDQFYDNELEGTRPGGDHKPRPPTIAALAQPASDQVKASVEQAAIPGQRFLSLEERVGKSSETITAEEEASNFILSVEFKIRRKAGDAQPGKKISRRNDGGNSPPGQPIAYLVMALV